MAEFDEASAQLLGPDGKPAPTFDEASAKFVDPPSSVARRVIGDSAVSLAKGVIGAGEAVVGVADVATLGHAGKALESVGWRPKEAKAMLDEYSSPEQRAANAEVQAAKGFFPTIAAAVQNPSVIAQSAIESAPSMFAGGAVGRGVRAFAPGAAPVIAGAVGEGAVGAGIAAEQIRQETADGLLTPGQAGLAATTGLVTGAITRLAGGVANKLGISDVDIMLAGGAAQGTNKGLIRRVAEGMISEGVLEELPQSAQEQILQNIALDQPWDKGVAEAAAMGALTGGLIGGGVNIMSGPISKAAEVGGVKEPPKLLPAPGAPGAPASDIGADAGAFGVTTDLDRQRAADNAAEIYAARAAVDAQRAAFAANGPISAAAAGAMDTGLTQAATARREGEINETLNPAAPLALPAPVAEKEKLDQQKVDEYLAGKDSLSLTEAQRKSFEGEARGHALVVVPHPSGKGYTTIPSSKLSDRQTKAVESIQRPDQGQLPSPQGEMPGQWVAPEGRTPEPRTYGENNAGMRAATDNWRTSMGTPVPRQMPIDDAKRAAAVAERKTQETGREHTVVPHPYSATKFAVAPVPTTIEGQATRVAEPAGAANASQEAAPPAQRQDAGLPNDQANGGGAPQAAGPSTAAEAPQAVAPAPGIGRVDNEAWAKAYPNETPEQWMRHAGESVDGVWLPRGAAAQAKATPAADLAARANEAATSLDNDLPQPTAAQAAAGNYRKGHAKLHGLDISIENPAGSVRIAKDGSWASAMPNHYGYIRRTEGNDGDHVDTFIGPKPESTNVFIVDQMNPKTGEFDEHKVLLGFDTQEAAEAGYKAAYPADWKGMGTVTATTVDGLKAWIKTGDTKAPFAKGGKPAASNKRPGGVIEHAIDPTIAADAPAKDQHSERLVTSNVMHHLDRLSTKGKALTPREQRVVTAVIGKLMALGKPRAFFDLVKSVVSMDWGAEGTYLWKTKTIGLDRAMLEAMANGDGLWIQKGAGTLAHELWHAADEGPQSFYSSDAESFKIGKLTTGRRLPQGAIVKEAYVAYVNHRDLRQYLSYPFAQLHNEPEAGVEEEHFTEMLQNEVFAQLGALYDTNPNMLRRTMPKAFALFKDIHERLEQSGNQADGIGAAVQQALRASGAVGRPAVDADRGANSADRAGPGNRDSRTGVGQAAGVGVGSAQAQDGAGQRSGQRDARLAAAPQAGQAQRLTDAPAGYEPSAVAQQTARDYMKAAGLPYAPPTDYVRVDPERAARIAQAYSDMPHAPRDIRVAAAYRALIKETLAQWKAIEKTGLKITFATEGKPYPYTVPGEVFTDVNENNHMWVFPTLDGFGSDASVDVSDNPLLADTGITIGGHKLVANDVFRIVHDYFGHIKDGVGFRANGEENAWRSHAAMFSPLARKAMTSETRGQNSWLNFGPHGEKNRKAKTEDTVFADQKTGLLPDWAIEDNYSSKPSALAARVPPVERIVKNDLTTDEQAILAAKKGKIREKAIENFLGVFENLPSADEFAAAAWSGRAKRGWYRHSAEAIAHVFGPDAPRFTALLAALSPQTSVEANLENALRVWKGWTQAGRPTDRRAILRIAGENVQGDKGEESVLGAWVNNMHRALISDNPIKVVLSGPKVDSFMRNLLGNVEEVTNDAWMANFALVDQTLFAGAGFDEEKRNPGKGYGYLAYSARVRQAAKRLTKLTGETWTPAEVQETVWSWAKTILEQAETEGVSSVDFLKSGKLTDELINATPDFRTLFHGGTYERILEQAGLGERVKSLRAAGQPDAGSGAEVAGAGSEAGPFTREAQAKLDERNAGRIDELRAQRASLARKTARDNVRRGSVHALRKGDAAYAVAARNGKGARLPVILQGQKFVPLQTLTPTAKTSAALERANSDAPIVHELPPEAADAFRKAISASKRGNKFAASVYVYDAADYAKMRLFITHGGKSGFALKGDDIVSVFRGGNMRNASTVLLHLAVEQGGRRLDAFDTVLPPLYADHGFVPAARVRWDDEQAPDGWDKKLYSEFRDGEPDVVFMAYDPEFFGEYKKTMGKAMPYDEAVAAQANAVLDLAARNEYRAEANKPDVMASRVPEAEPLWQSGLTDAVASKAPWAKDGTIPAGQLRMWLAARTKDGVVKAEELKWSGLEEWLDTQSGRVSRDAVGAFLADNGVKVEEVTLGEQGSAGEFDEWLQRERQMTMAEFHAEPMDAQDDLVGQYNSSFGTDAKFADYQLPGGENYRELLLTLPKPDPNSRLAKLKAARASMTDQAAIDRANDEMRKLQQLAAADPITRASVLGTNGVTFRSSHFPDNPNILAHIRFNERADADGKRVLFIEEIQSDWAQKGRKEGFNAKAVSAEPLGDWENIKKPGNPDDVTRMYRVTYADGKTQDMYANKGTDPVELANGKLERLGRAPLAPFVGKTEAWVALALKRMIRYASDNGFDRVAWTTGEQQADRYDLSKQVDKIIYGSNPSDGTFNVMVMGRDGAGEIWSKMRATAGELSDVVGKEVVEKMTGGAGQKHGSANGAYDKSLSGLDLKVGGEGMRAFYDKIVPNVANDLLKKMGGGRVEEKMVRTRQVAMIGGRWGVLEDDGDISNRTPPTNVKKFHKLGTSPQLGFDITPEMLPRARKPQAMFSRVSAATVVNGVQDLLSTSRSFNLWDRTVGTQLNKALKNPEFKKVYDGVQSFLNDSSQMMMESADLAPDLLPKLDGLKDVLKRGPSKADIEKVSSAVFDGTINDVVWSDAELRTRGMDDKQIGLYRQARAAIDKSLSDVMASEAIKQAKGLLPQSVLDQAKTAGDAWVVVNALSAIAARTPVQQQVYDQLRKRAAEMSDLQTKGYAPLQRFGQYTVHVVNQDGSSALFTMHESEREANAFARAARATLTPGQTLTQGVMSQEAWKLFNGVSPDTMEIFAESIGASQSEVMQKYIKLAANNRSVLKRMLQRKEIAGFQTDVQRTLAQFVTSNARAAARNYHWGRVLKDANEIPKEAGDVKDEAVKLAQYMENGQDEAGAVRGLLFIQFLGGSIASALTNATQPVMMTFPWLAQYGGAIKAAAQLTRASKVAVGGAIAEPGLRDAMERATKEGIVAPHEVAGLYAESIRNFGSNMAVRRALKVWGSMFSVAEAFNRRITFVAAYRTAVEQNMADPYAFATRAIAETQGVYNKGNRPNWARGAVGATLFTFKQYSVAYVEMLNRLPAKQKALALAVLVLAAGLQGLPGADDLEDVIDTIAESLGYSFNSKKQLREWAARTLGDTAGGLLTHGVSSLPGVPIDWQGRLGMGNLFPGTSLLKRSSTDKGRDVLEFFGPAGSQAQAFLDAFSAAQEGDAAAMAKAGVPLAVKNALKGIDMAQTGFYTDMKGRRVIDVDAYDAAIKGIGFQPNKVAKQTRVVQDIQQDINLAKDVEAKLVERMARGIFERDPEAVQKARVDLLQWNRTNEGSRIAITPSQVRQRVQQMMLTREQRFVKTAPKEMRVGVREELRQ